MLVIFIYQKYSGWRSAKADNCSVPDAVAAAAVAHANACLRTDVYKYLLFVEMYRCIHWAERAVQRNALRRLRTPSSARAAATRQK